MAFNPLVNFNQGLEVGQNIQASQRRNQISGLQDALTGQIQQGGFNPSQSLDFQQLSVLDPEGAERTRSTFENLSGERKKAYHQDLQGVLNSLKAGDVEGAATLLNDRRNDVLSLKGDTSGVDLLIGKLNEGAFPEMIEKLGVVEQVGIANGDLPDPAGAGRRSVQSSKIMDDGTVIQVMKGGGRQVISNTGVVLTGEEAKQAVSTSRDQAFNRKKELARLGQLIRKEESKDELLNAQQKSIQSGNIKRLGTLSSTSSGRSSAIKKATKFKLALESGDVFSGAGRRAASFIPGVFTSQGQFDEEFNAFSEVAARQQLKASGETRPTDADVQGMKQAMFGLGRDEAVNVQLLSDFIVDQNAQNNELDQLINASKGGSLSNFTFTPLVIEQEQPIVQQRPATELSDEELSAELAALQGGL